MEFAEPITVDYHSSLAALTRIDTIGDCVVFPSDRPLSPVESALLDTGTTSTIDIEWRRILTL